MTYHLQFYSISDEKLTLEEEIKIEAKGSLALIKQYRNSFFMASLEKDLSTYKKNAVIMRYEMKFNAEGKREIELSE